jgi:hypothetical protein
MAIADIVTGGFGSFGSIGEVVTFGFGIGEAPIVQQRVGGASYLTREEFEAYQARLKTLENARKRLRRKEIQKWAGVREAADEVFNPKPASEPEIALVAVKERVQHSAPQPTVATAPDPRMAALRAEIRELNAKIAQFKAEQDDEEDDLEALLLLIH